MAYTAGNLHLRAGAPGDLTYTYDAGSDTLATVSDVGYFNNTDDDSNLTAEDLIWVQAGDGNCWLRVASISSGSVTTQFAGGNLPIRTSGTNTGTGGVAAVAQPMFAGAYEDGSATAGADSTATRHVLPTPYPGLEIMVRRTDSGTAPHEYDAGGSGATAVTFDSIGKRRFIIQEEGEWFHVVGVSTSRWKIMGAYHGGSIGGSVQVAAGASRFPGPT